VYKEKAMKKAVGLWIDHRKAVIVVITQKHEEIKLIISKVDKQLGRSNGIRSTTRYEPQQVPADDRRERKLTAHLNLYYDAVVSCLRDAEAILLFGPGEAKGELKKRIQRSKLGGRIVGIETVDKMSDRQVAAKVRLQFVTKRTPS
jgi:hypothetical protein